MTFTTACAVQDTNSQSLRPSAPLFLQADCLWLRDTGLDGVRNILSTISYRIFVTMAENTPSNALKLTPMYVLFILAICICGFLFWSGTLCVRLWFYRGALGPEPEKFIVMPLHLKRRL
jgi:hypothetical protein